jgi:anti-sigma factor RsiW
MNCEVAQEWIVTAAYDELPEEEAHELERHMEGCPGCQQERKQLLALQALAGADPVAEPDANLAARARLKLDAALDALPAKRWYERWSAYARVSFARVGAAPVAALLALAVGAGAGGWGGYRLAQQRKTAPAVAQSAAAPAAETRAQPAETANAVADVASVSAVVRKPNSDVVDVTYKQLVPRHIEGTVDNPAIRQLLVLASADSASPRVRGDSVSLLAAGCRTGRRCQQAGVRDALMIALRYDANPAVREKALEGLEPYVAQDVRVRDAVLEALMNDSDPRIRSASINLLAPVEADASVRQVLYNVSNSDDSPQIRNVSRQILNQVPEIQ